MQFQVGEGVRAAMRKHDDEPVGDEIFEQPSQRYSITPGKKNAYLAHKTYNPNNPQEHIGFEVYLLPKS